MRQSAGLRRRRRRLPVWLLGARCWWSSSLTEHAGRFVVGQHMLFPFGVNGLALVGRQQDIVWRQQRRQRQQSPLRSFAPRIGAASIPGSDPNRPNKVNQDAYFYTTATMAPNAQTTTTFGLAGVMDGHGKGAERLVEYLRDHLPVCVEQQINQPQRMTELEAQIEKWVGGGGLLLSPSPDDDDEICKSLRHAFHQAHWDAMQNPQVPAGRCGTTCIVCLWPNNHDQRWLYVAHVGDSAIYRFGSKSLTAEPLATPTTTQVASERQRILKTEHGRIDPMGNVWYGPVGIAMTRALGDAVMLQAGVLPTPVIETHAMRPAETEWIVLATDGVWDALTVEEVHQFLLSTTTTPVPETAKQLAALAKEAWATRHNGPGLFDDEVSSDDIACVVIRFGGDRE